MPKMKTKKKVAKRFRITKNGKVLANRSGRRHLLGDKRSKPKRHKRKILEVTGNMAGAIKQQLPYA